MLWLITVFLSFFSFSRFLLLKGRLLSLQLSRGARSEFLGEMSGMQEQFEIKFRLPDGTDIGPKQYPAASTVATLKETIIAQWPKGFLPSSAPRSS